MSQQKKILKISVNNAKIAELFDKILKDVDKLKNNVANLEINKLSITEFQQQKQIILDEISAVKALITADEATLKKIQDIIKDLENVEQGVLTRVAKLENITFAYTDNDCANLGEVDFKDIISFRVRCESGIISLYNEETKFYMLKIRDNYFALKSDIPNLDNYYDKTQIDNKLNDKAEKSDLTKIQTAINYPNQLSQTFFQAIDLERNIENGLIGLKSLFDKFFPQRHNFKFEINFNFDASTGNILKSETKYQNNTLIINFFGNGKQLKFGSKIYDNILDMQYFNDYDNNIEYLKWWYLDNDNNLQNSNSKKDSTILEYLKTNNIIINIREGYGLHYGVVNWNQENLTNYKLKNFKKYQNDDLSKFYSSMKNKNCLNCKQLLDNCWCWKNNKHYGRY